jgi:hypothetical protein
MNMALREFVVIPGKNEIKIYIPGTSRYNKVVNLECVKVAIDELREELAKLCDEYVKNGPAERLNEKRSILEGIAMQGAIVKNLLFDRKNADLLDEVLAPGDSERTLCLFKDQAETKIHVPWGLLYDLPSDQSKIEEISDERLRDGFWCMKYDVCAVYSSDDQTNWNDADPPDLEL